MLYKNGLVDKQIFVPLQGDATGFHWFWFKGYRTNADGLAREDKLKQHHQRFHLQQCFSLTTSLSVSLADFRVNGTHHLQGQLRMSQLTFL